MFDIVIYITINFICGIIVMIWHELPKSVAAYFLTHSVFRKKQMALPNPLKYIDPIGLILFGFSSFGIGWQKPYEHNPNRLRDKERSLLTIMLIGQLATLLFMFFLLPVSSYLDMIGGSRFLMYAVTKLIIFNMVIFIVNLLPVPPLDMSKIIHAMSPNTYFRLMQNERYIHSAFILLVAFGFVESFVGQILMSILRVFM